MNDILSKIKFIAPKDIKTIINSNKQSQFEWQKDYYPLYITIDDELYGIYKMAFTKGGIIKLAKEVLGQHSDTKLISLGDGWQLSRVLYINPPIHRIVKQVLINRGTEYLSSFNQDKNAEEFLMNYLIK